MSRISERLKETAEEFVAHPWLFVRLTVEFLIHENRKYLLKQGGVVDAEEE